LDTGNRSAFDNAPTIDLQPDFSQRAMNVWARNACAPLVLDGPAVIAARKAVQRRATALGFFRTADAGLRVLADGVPVAAYRDGAMCSVRLPAGTRDVRLLSNIWVPAHMRSAESDTRTLGVAVSRLWLDGREVALDSPGLCAGWHAAEPGLRWTDGDARIAVADARAISFSVAMTGCYWRNSIPAIAMAG
jgi:hypothetical protein